MRQFVSYTGPRRYKKDKIGDLRHLGVSILIDQNPAMINLKK